MSKKYQNKVLSIIRSTNRMKNVPCAQPHHELIKDLYYGPSANRLLTVNLQKEFDIVGKSSQDLVRGEKLRALDRDAFRKAQVPERNCTGRGCGPSRDRCRHNEKRRKGKRPHCGAHWPHPFPSHGFPSQIIADLTAWSTGTPHGSAFISVNLRLSFLRHRAAPFTHATSSSARLSA